MSPSLPHPPPAIQAPAEQKASPASQPAGSAEHGQVHLTVNGETVTLPVDNRESLLDFLRERLALTGTKKGCDLGQCGTCTVHLNGRRVLACLTMTRQANMADVRTIEGVGEGGTLHPLQQAFIENDALQCGFCTPGQIMSGIACIQEGHARTEDDVREYMSGNLCRCGAYAGIVAAVHQVASGRTGAEA